MCKGTTEDRSSRLNSAGELEMWGYLVSGGCWRDGNG